MAVPEKQYIFVSPWCYRKKLTFTYQDFPKPFEVLWPGPPLRDVSEKLRSLSGLLE